MISEEWISVEGFSDYSINPLGEVRKDSTGRVLHIRLNQYGVPYVGLMRDHKQRVRSLPRLVAEAFLPQPNDIFDTPINIDGDRKNCRVDNLVWRPRWYAVHYVNQFCDRYSNPIEEPIREINTGTVFPNSLAAGCAYGILEREVVLATLNRTPAWPTYQTFELVEFN